QVREASVNALRKLGKRISPDSLNILEKIFTSQNLYSNSKLFKVLPELKQIELQWVIAILNKGILEDEKERRYYNSILCGYKRIGRLFPKEAITELLLLLSMSEFHLKERLVPVLGLLGQISPVEALSQFEDQLKKDPSVGIYLIEAIGYFCRSHSSELVSFFSSLLKQDDEGLNKAAIKSLAIMGRDQESASNRAILSLLLDEQEEENPCVATARMKAVGQVGRVDTSRVFPMFCLKINSSDAQLKIQIVKAFGKIGKASPEIANCFLKDVVGNLSENVKIKPLLSLTEVSGDHLSTTIESLVDLFDRGNCDEKCRMLKVFGSLWKHAPVKVCRGLTDALENPYGTKVKKCAVNAIYQIAQTNLPLVNALLLFAFAHSDIDIALEAIRGLPKLSHMKSSCLIDYLQVSFQHSSSAVIQQAILMLCRLKQIDLKQALSLLEKWILKSEVKKEIYFALNSFDLSDYPQLIQTLLRDYYIFQQYYPPLSSTPLSTLLRKYAELKKGSQKTYYLLASIVKILSENQPIFLKMNDLCLFEKGQIRKIAIKDPIRCKREIQEAFHLHGENLLACRAQQQKNKGNHALAGYYYKQAVYIDQMFAAFELGADEDKVEALYALGLFYHAGIGSQRKVVENYQSVKDLKKAIVYYELAHKQCHAASSHLLGICHQYGLGVESTNFDLAFKYYRNASRIALEQKLGGVPIDLPLHCFHTMPIPFLVDTNKTLPAAGTISLALGSLASGLISQEEIEECIMQKKRPDIELKVPYVSINKHGDLWIDLSKSLVNNQSLADKLFEFGLTAEPINYCKFNRRFVLRYQVPRYEIHYFLLNKLWLHSAVYENLRFVYPQIEESVITKVVYF
nr:SEL1-like repeat protein [Parachlamydiaceae bacterium]